MKYSICHPDRPAKAKGLCDSCYGYNRRKVRKANSDLHKSPIKVNPEIKAREEHMPRVDKLEVREHVAASIIANQMDVDKAVKKMMPDAPLEVRREVSRKLESDPHVKAEIERALEADGLDEHSKVVFVRKMWNWLEYGNPRQQETAARILGKGFIGEKVTAEKPEDLPIAGFKEGVAKMLGEVPRTPLPVSPAVSPATKPSIDTSKMN